MNRESEAINKFLAWLLQETDPTVTTPSGECSNQGTGTGTPGAASSQFNPLDLLDSEDMDDLLPIPLESNPFSFQNIPTLEPGDRPAVQDRFHSLLKRRLRVEIERKPPLFPWETEISDYSAESPDWVTNELVPSTLWIAQLRNLKLPTRVPDDILARLFEQCQQLVQTSLQEGARLVEAVESLFPGHPQALNEVAGRVLTAYPARSGEQARLPEDYNVANQPERMLLTMLAAREIMESLTLSVSPHQPKVERQWMTDAGPLTLLAEYPATTGLLRIQSQLPCSGSLQLRGTEVQTSAQRKTPGSLGLEVVDVAPNQVYPVEVRLAGSDHAPLTFVVHPTLGMNGDRR